MDSQAATAPSIDTGMGLERMCAVPAWCRIEITTPNLVTPILEAIGSLAGTKYGRSMNPEDVSMRVVADHARTMDVPDRRRLMLPTSSRLCTPKDYAARHASWDAVGPHGTFLHSSSSHRAQDGRRIPRTAIEP